MSRNRQPDTDWTNKKADLDVLVVGGGIELACGVEVLNGESFEFQSWEPVNAAASGASSLHLVRGSQAIPRMSANSHAIYAFQM